MSSNVAFQSLYFSRIYVSQCLGPNWEKDRDPLWNPVFQELSSTQKIGYVALIILDGITWIFRRVFHEINTWYETSQRNFWLKLDREIPESSMVNV